MLWHSKAQEVLIGMYEYVLEIFQALQMRQLIFCIHQREYDQYLVKVFYHFEQLTGHHSFQQLDKKGIG